MQLIRYLIFRPVGVLFSFLVLLALGGVLFFKVPVSLLPNIDVPRIVIKVNSANTSAAVIQRSIVSLLTENLGTLNNLKNIESKVTNHAGWVYLDFEYGTRMDLAYVEVNEKIDRLSQYFPRNLPRPLVTRINTTDIPVVRLQIVPNRKDDYVRLSLLAEKVLAKRLEQIAGVSMVDINGKVKSVVVLKPNKQILNAIRMDEHDIINAIQNSNGDLGALSIRDGQYQYFVKLSGVLEGAADIEKLSLTTKQGNVISLAQVCKVESVIEKQVGYHLYNGERGIVITIQKQASARMGELMSELREVINQFGKDYPEISFVLTQDQTFVLDEGIGNLQQDLMYGGVLTILLLFVFLGNWISPALMSINIPISLIISFSVFYLFDVSFNIISLSGLALGVGMLIDNSIVVIDSITRKNRSGLGVEASVVEGTNLVVAPVVSQVLTTVAVYAPLVLLPGISGDLVKDQSIALTISLSVSLLVAFILSPVLYRLLMKASGGKVREDTAIYKWISRGYHRMVDHILRYKQLCLFITILLMPVGFIIATAIPVSSLPEIEKKESLIEIDWNEPIDAEENMRRTTSLLNQIKSGVILTEAEIGIRQFVLQESNSSIQSTTVYYLCKDEEKKLLIDELAKEWISKMYSPAHYAIRDAPNAFTQLFVTNKPFFEARFYNNEGEQVGQRSGVDDLAGKPGLKGYSLGEGSMMEPCIEISLDYEKIALYGIQQDRLIATLEQTFGAYLVSEIKRFGDVQFVRFQFPGDELGQKLKITLPGKNNEQYALDNFVKWRFAEQPKCITADRNGTYQSVIYGKSSMDFNKLQQQIVQLALGDNVSVRFVGQYFDDHTQLRQLIIIFLIVFFLMYFILAIQYESLILPLLIMLTIPLGISGAMFLLWLTGGTLNVMTAIGFVVVLGLIVDDPILKIETLNKLWKGYKKQGLQPDERLLRQMIHEAGESCLKPLLMVSLTTSLALTPVLFIPGLGNDLQKPMVWVIVGGLTIGTFFTTWFIPLSFWYVVKWFKL